MIKCVKFVRVIKNIRNIIRIFIALLILSGGNFVFAIAHSDCLISSDMHITCEMECCKIDPCAEDEDNGIVKIVDESDSCCKTHIDQAAEQDTPVLHINKNTTSKTVVTAGIVTVDQLDTKGYNPVIHKFKTTNILLINSVLQI